MTDRAFSGAHCISIIAFQQASKFLRDACNSHEGAEMGRFKQILRDLGEAAVISSISLAIWMEGTCGRSSQIYVSNVWFILNEYAAYEILGALHAESCGLSQRLSAPFDPPQQLSTKILVCGSVYDAKC